jgi:hypothetical protein
MAVKHTIQINKNGQTQEKNLTPMKAIRFNCLECCNFSIFEVRECGIKQCALWPFRFGKGVSGRKGNPNPNSAGLKALKKWQENNKGG